MQARDQKKLEKLRAHIELMCQILLSKLRPTGLEPVTTRLGIWGPNFE